jgi:hypothetical protein
MFKLHHYEHNDNYLGLKPMPLTRERNLHTKHGSKKICAPNLYQERTKNLEYIKVLTKNNVAGE